MFKKTVLVLFILNFTNYQTQATANLVALKCAQTHISSVAFYSISSNLTSKDLTNDPLINHAKTDAKFRDENLKKRFDKHPLRSCFQDKQISYFLKHATPKDRENIRCMPILFNQNCIEQGSPEDQISFWAIIDILRGNYIRDENYRLLYYYLTYRVNIFKTVEQLDHKQALKIINKIEKMANKLQAMGGELVFTENAKDEMLCNAFKKHVHQDLRLIKSLKPILENKKEQISKADLEQCIQGSGYQKRNLWIHDRFDKTLFEMVSKINCSQN